jgi:recombination protein RecT
MSEQNMMTKREQPKNVAMALQQDGIQKRIESLLGKRSAQFCSTLVAISNQPQLRDCEPFSVIGSAITAATMDLPINQNLGFAHIVPYGGKSGKTAQFQMGFKGFIQLALRTGQYKTINDAVIPHGVLVSYNEVTGQLILDFEKEKEGPADGYVCFFELTNGFSKTVFWTRQKVEKHAQQFSQSYRKGFGPWKDNFDAMALKTVIKAALSKYGILSIEMQTALERDQAVVTGGADEFSDQIDFVDNDVHAAVKMEAPEMGEPEPARKPNTDLNGDSRPNREPPAVGNMSKIELLQELKEHEGTPAHAKAMEMLPEGCQAQKAPTDFLRDMVELVRNGGEK